MDSSNYFVSGFVKEVGANVFGNICLIVGRVSHSQKLSETLPTAWVIAEMGCKVLSAHCNCMAELGEACSHIGAILFYCKAATEKKYLVLPSNQEVSYKEVSDIDFSCPNTSEYPRTRKKRRLKKYHLQHRLK